VTTHPAPSEADARAPLPAPGRENRTASPGAHAQPEAMGLSPATVVRLKSTLTHEELQVRQVCRYNSRVKCKSQAAALNLAGYNNCQLRTHPRDRPYLQQAMKKLHRGNRTCQSYAHAWWRVKPAAR
jgi:hypothetical protein